ncbi:MAG: DALR domain-containing protein [Candidatus Heimdallarchaeaceae archaeon]
MEQAQITADRLFNTIFLVKYYSKNEEIVELNEKDTELIERTNKARDSFIKSMDEDFNTSIALSVIFDLAREVNEYVHKEDRINAKVMQEVDKFFNEFRSIFGLFENFNQYSSIETIEKLVKLLIELRQSFRKEKKWEMSDKIRDELKKAGIALEDTPKRVLWKLKEE